MYFIFKKPLFWSNVAAFLVTGLVVAGVALAWNSPSSGPTMANGAISVNAAGNVGIGVLPDALAKLHLNGDLLIDAGNGITMGGIKKTDWLMQVGSAIGCSETTTNYFLCLTVGVGEFHGLQLNLPGGVIQNPIVTSTPAAGATPNSSIGCSRTTTNYFLCIATGNGIIYGLQLNLPGGVIQNPIVTSKAVAGVTPHSKITCSATTTNYFLCFVSGTNIVYGVQLNLPGGVISTPVVTSTAASGVSVPQ